MESFKITNIDDDFVSIEILEGDEEGLFFEKTHLISTMRLLESKLRNQVLNYKIKSSSDSAKCRKEGNNIFATKSHNLDKHIEILNLYSQSIALAPNKSEELAFAYGNRSAILYHLEKYDESIKDCDRALNMTCSELVKAKLLFRKIECLVALKNSTAKSICEKTLASFELLHLPIELKNKFIDKLNETLKTISVDEFKDEEAEKTKKKLPTPIPFTPQTEASCASTAISIKHNDKWGRHIVATQKIEPGQILVVEKNYLTSIELSQLYLFCSNCSEQTWASIPCDSCMYNIYCSEKCKSDAWRKYHKFECSVFSFIYSIDVKNYVYLPDYDTKEGKSNLRFFRLALRFLLLSVHKFGSINKLKKELIDTQYFRDLREQGFSPDGTFQSEKCRSIWSLETNRDNLNFTIMAESATITSICIYYLAKETLFFGKKFTCSASQLMLNEDIKLVGALLLKNLQSIRTNSVNVQYFMDTNGTLVKHAYGLSLNAFCNLFNHSCDPNVKFIFSKNNERIIYATRIIEKGEQLFLCYVGEDYTTFSKAVRRETLETLYCFDCECLACKEDWPRTLRSVKDILKESLELRPSLERKYDNLKMLKNNVFSYLKKNNFHYEPKIMEDLKKLMLVHDENFTVRSEDYKIFENWMQRLLLNGFGKRFNMADKC